MPATHRRAPIVLSATALGLAATLGFHAHQPEAATASAPTTTATTKTTTTTTTTRAASNPTPSTTTKTGTGTASTPYGDLQLKVTVANGKITKIEPVALPSNDPKSQQINAYAEPLLQQSALSRQDGTVDAVTGATFTSTGYQTALQAALDQAGFSPATS